MLFKLYLPYIAAGSSNDAEGFYATEQDYVDALNKEEQLYGGMVFNAISGMGSYPNGISYQGAKETGSTRSYQEKIELAKTTCVLFSPNGSEYETVDSMIDKFVAQKPFIVTVRFNMSTMDGEFEEELVEWWKETMNILILGKKTGGDFVEKNIPRRELMIEFQNKSNKTVSFNLTGCEIEERPSKDTLVLYVGGMKINKQRVA